MTAISGVEDAILNTTAVICEHVRQAAAGGGALSRRLPLIVVRGAGDLATGTILTLSRAGFPVVALECARPTAIRRGAAFSEAVRFGEKTVEGLTCRLAGSPGEALQGAAAGQPVILVDEDLRSLSLLRPAVLVDAMIAKRNRGTRLDMADLVIGLGPGFTAGVDVHAVIETMRGHDLGRIIEEGSAVPDTGIPGMIGGYGRERVIHAPAEGILHNLHEIGDLVESGELLTEIEGEDGRTPVPATLTGVLRGILPDGYAVPRGMKLADIDPRARERKNCVTVSDKARCIAGSVLLLVTRQLLSGSCPSGRDGGCP